MTTDPRALVGRWTIRRRVADRRAGVLGTMTGELELQRDGDGLVWDERGVLRWLGRDADVSRRYLLGRDGDGDWWVRFADGRPFHPWTPGTAVEHPCRDDLYRGLVDVTSRDRWRVLWDVVGPAKDQRLVTRLTRRPG